MTLPRQNSGSGIIRDNPTFSDTPQQVVFFQRTTTIPNRIFCSVLRGEKNLSGPRRSQADPGGP
jgi:hypothetical protein